ncbi:MAG: glutamine-hydrolyzing carbamoyl-phosphate synthase small subunit [Eubacteriales bacterium]|nr:glutamine-hydrolyzing carbamoyl-phosphate synthase small subunit [Eubacteriales bacterium]
MEAIKRKLVMENGTEFEGTAFGAVRDAVCEMVFNTSMAGYQEIVTDPSYTAQMVTMTYPLIGNYGVTDEDYETYNTPAMGALVVREYNDIPSNYRYTKTLGELLEDSGIPGLQGVDTRMIGRMIRNEGSQRGLICAPETPHEEAMERIRAYELPRDVVSRVSCKKKWYGRTPNAQYNVVCVDCGVKLNIIRKLKEKGCNVIVVPYDTPAETVMSFRPDGLFLSNGPGDPEDVKPVIRLVQTLRGQLPIFGICLGHQMIALAGGAKTFKMKFGHRGGNHPVENLETGKVEITSQNHSFAVDVKSLEGTGLTLTHQNLLDRTAEGLCCEKDRLFSVQYHPESAPGPQDSAYLFDKFIRLMAADKEGSLNA